MTNKEDARVFGDEWIPMDAIEFKAFIGLLYLAGVYRSAGEATQELWHVSDGRKIFRAAMSLKRFKQISRVLRFDDKESRAGRRAKDKLAPIREVFDLWVETLPKSFVAKESVTVDEQLVAFRGRCSFRQFMKSKPAKYGLKLWILCDSSTSYALNVQVYTGRRDGEQVERNQGQRIVHDLVEVIRGTGRNVTVDNFFTSVTLARQLQAKKLSLVGTMRSNKREIPPEFLASKDRPVYSSIFGHQNQLTLVSYVPKKNKAVIVLSSMHTDAGISDRPDKKPEIIMWYNQTKGGVDTLDQMVSTYSTKRMTRRWPMVIFYDMLDICAVNSFVLWTAINPNWHQHNLHRRRLFLKEMGQELVKEKLQSRLAIPGLSLKLRAIVKETLDDYTAKQARGNADSAEVASDIESETEGECEPNVDERTSAGSNRK